MNENQLIVLDWLKKGPKDCGASSCLNTMFFFIGTSELVNQDNLKMVRAYRELDNQKFLQVLSAFAEWGLKQC